MPMVVLAYQPGAAVGLHTPLMISPKLAVPAPPAHHRHSLRVADGLGVMASGFVPSWLTNSLGCRR